MAVILLAVTYQSVTSGRKHSTSELQPVMPLARRHGPAVLASSRPPLSRSPAGARPTRPAAPRSARSSSRPAWPPSSPPSRSLIVLGHRAGRVASSAAPRLRGARSPACPAGPRCRGVRRPLLIAVIGMYWDISLHIDNGRDPGPLANPAHYLILVGLFGIFIAGCSRSRSRDEKPSRDRRSRIAPRLDAPARRRADRGLRARFALIGFPLDDIWHRMFGQDVTLWGPTHLMLIGGAALTLARRSLVLVAEGGSPPKARRERPRRDEAARLADRCAPRARSPAALAGRPLDLPGASSTSACRSSGCSSTRC